MALKAFRLRFAPRTMYTQPRFTSVYTNHRLHPTTVYTHHRLHQTTVYTNHCLHQNTVYTHHHLHQTMVYTNQPPFTPNQQPPFVPTNHRLHHTTIYTKPRFAPTTVYTQPRFAPTIVCSTHHLTPTTVSSHQATVSTNHRALLLTPSARALSIIQTSTDPLAIDPFPQHQYLDFSKPQLPFLALQHSAVEAGGAHQRRLNNAQGRTPHGFIGLHVDDLFMAGDKVFARTSR